MTSCFSYYLWGVATPFLALVVGLVVGFLACTAMGDEVARIERHGEPEK